MKYFLEMKFLLRNLMTLKQKTNQYDELKMEKKKSQASGFWFKWAMHSTFQAIAKTRDLAKPDCWNHYYIFLLHS